MKMQQGVSEHKNQLWANKLQCYCAKVTYGSTQIHCKTSGILYIVLGCGSKQRRMLTKNNNSRQEYHDDKYP